VTDVVWRLRPRWLLVTGGLCLAWAAVWVVGLAAFGALDKLVTFAYVILGPAITNAAGVWGRRVRVTDSGLEYVGSVSRLSIAWPDVEVVDRRHLAYSLARETTNETGLKISMDAFIRAMPRGQRRVPLHPFVDDERYSLLLSRLAEHRPDLVAPRDGKRRE
jgi:hypothetical protein